jgi:hypothetical protein
MSSMRRIPLVGLMCWIVAGASGVAAGEPVLTLEALLSRVPEADRRFEVRKGTVSTGPARTPTGGPALMPRSTQLVKVIDPGEASPLDFAAGDTLTIEAWVRLDESPGGTFPYIVGKGRTHTVAGKGNDANQNYALRLQGGGSTRLSFLWMDAAGPRGAQRAHRWTSTDAVAVDGRWHHVTLSYTFGTGGDVLATIDGRPTDGVWDMEGNSSAPPVVDDDDLWIGGSHGAGHTFPGLIEGLAIHRERLPPELIAEKTAWVDAQQPRMPWPAESLEATPGAVRVVIADLPMRSWFFEPSHTEPVFATDGVALTRLPHRYDARGLITDRPGATMVRMVTEDRFPKGRCRLLLRSLDAARVYMDGELLAEQKTAAKPSGSAHGKVYELAEPPAGVVRQTGAHTDTLVEFESDGEPHRFEVYRLLGGDGRVPQLGELLVAIAADGEPFRVLGGAWQPDDAGWQALLDRENSLVTAWNRAARGAADAAEDAFWNARHAEAAAAAFPPVPVPAIAAPSDHLTAIDRFLLAPLEADGLEPMPLVDDDSFLRRVTLDITGRIPTVDELRAWGRDSASPLPLDRGAVIDGLLVSDEWADHWTSYWMDVLAENPALTKPTLNNSGPFRWYIHDSLIDNVGMDRFVTNLIRMGGSKALGGPAGFGVASENDVPMAAKAHVLGTAFLGVEMKCARCHDAPNHPFQQSDLFAFAAMLEGKPLEVPATSSIPATPEELEEMIVSVSIKPGAKIAPAWPFEELTGEQPVVDGPHGERPREALAWAITSPANIRFREVLANRLWTRLIGRGLVDSASDWSERRPSHPELLRFLARELLVNGDDLRHLAGLIMRSAVYQRQVVPGVSSDDPEAAAFRGPIRRRLTAEQLVDSLHVATGKPMRGEVQSFAQDGSQPRTTFPEMGRPSRAWQLVCSASERDRISLGIPQVDMLNELLAAYGWRPQRQDPQERPDEPPTPLRPLALANGPAAAALLDATPDAWLTEAACEAESPEAFVQMMACAVLGRRATDAELVRWSALVSDGFATRQTGEADTTEPVYRRRISWRNHFDPVADELVRRRIAELEAGATPTRRLTAAWRERAEDLQWVLVNSPEFVWIP